MPKVYLTVDLEPDCPPYLWTWAGIETGAPKLLDLLSSEGVPATYFTTGDTARTYPSAVTALVEAGHELACHGMSHRSFDTMSEQDAEGEIAQSAEILRGFAPVTSFRAPYLQFPERFVPILERHGFLLDSSRAKYKWRSRRDAPSSAIARVSASTTSSVLRLPAALRDPLLRRLKSPVVIFVHPWEFVDLTRERLRLDCRFKTGDVAIDCLRSVIRLFKAEGATFGRMNELVPQRRESSDSRA